MKRLVLATLIVVSSSILNAKSCSEEQIGNIIKQNLSQATIDSICKDDEQSNNKQVVVNITNSPVNNNTNTNNVGRDSYQNKSTDNREYFFWRFGIGNMSISKSDWSEASFNFGLQYFMNGLKENGFGIGYSASVSSVEEETYTSGYYYNYYTTTIRTISTSEIELLYNANIGNGFSITPSYITGSITQDDDGITTYESDISGFGVYLNFPSIVKSGQGLSVFVKKLSADNGQDIALTGLQFVW